MEKGFGFLDFDFFFCHFSQDSSQDFSQEKHFFFGSAKHFDDRMHLVMGSSFFLLEKRSDYDHDDGEEIDSCVFVQMKDFCCLFFVEEECDCGHDCYDLHLGSLSLGDQICYKCNILLDSLADCNP